MLNSQQKAAIQYIDGPLFVLAGAGSGKTRVITEKIAYLIETCGYSPSTIFAVTFTNKAANEMRERVTSLLNAKARRGLNIGTFHTLGLTILKKEKHFCGLKQGFSIFDAEDCLQLLKQLLPASRAQVREEMQWFQQQISRWKNSLCSPAYLRTQELANERELSCVDIYEQYQALLSAYNGVDFDDLLRLPVLLFKQNKERLEYWQNKMGHLLIDEYQDSNPCQYELMKLLVSRNEKFTVVGDDDQSIYAWRGAKPENLNHLQQDFPKLKIIKLEQNYRSTVSILQAANHLISHNPHLFSKKLWSELGHGELIRVILCKDELDEAEKVVADMIHQHLRLRIPFSEFAILYRGNHQSRIFEKVLRQHGIAYQLSGGQSWFSRSEVKDIFAYFKLLCNELDDNSFLRIINTPRRGIGETTLKALGEYAQQKGESLYQCCDHYALSEWIEEKPRQALHLFKKWIEQFKARVTEESVDTVLKDLVQQSGYEAYRFDTDNNPQKAAKSMEQVWELVDWIKRLQEKDEASSLADTINKLILIDILERSDAQDEGQLQLMTLHASKGLEFPYVYLVGLEEELLPHRVSMEEDMIEEERRLAYVGITRAKKAVTITLAKQRRRGGETQVCLPSRFLDELPQDLLEWFGKTTHEHPEKSKALANSHLEGIKNLLQG